MYKTWSLRFYYVNPAMPIMRKEMRKSSFIS
nr:MAG TPA: hypothetical protein [Caudoviricetes sp.]